MQNTKTQFSAIAFMLFFALAANAQNSKCNNLGVWLWRLEYTNVKNHNDLADSLKRLGISRLYIKVLDGRSFDKWTQHSDTALVKLYRKKGIDIWAWTYNYPNNEAAQAAVVEKVAKTGYSGLIVDVEVEFEDDSLALYKLFDAFGKARQNAINQGLITNKFELRCTTWGNPDFHDFNIKAIDPFVQGYMPQTYVEQWGKSYSNNLEKWIDEGTKEYKRLGATKPIYHIVASENNSSDTTKYIITAAQLNRFITKAGSQTSVWAVPQKPVNKIWNTWKSVTWKKDFACPPTTEDAELAYFEQVSLFPNPFDDYINLDTGDYLFGSIDCQITDINGRVLKWMTILDTNRIRIDTSDLEKGMYLLNIRSLDKTRTWKVVKI
jgi:hypothetical protein